MNARQRWRNAVRDSGLDQSARAVAWTLDTYMDGSGVGWPSRASIATGAACSVDTVDRALKRLEWSGLVRVRRSRGRWVNTYYATLPNGRTGAPVGAVSTAAPAPLNSRTGAARTRSTEQEDLRAREEEQTQEPARFDSAMLELARSWLTT